MLWTRSVSARTSTPGACCPAAAGRSLFGYLQGAKQNGQRTYQVYRWYDGQDGSPSDTGVWRAYNYVHVANTYFNMYRIGRAYPGLRLQYTATQYLGFCYQTLNAMFSKIPQPTPIGDAAHDAGLMGESTYPDILSALAAEGMAAERQQLQAYVQHKRDALFSQTYPFASEQSIDTTGFEASYTLAKLYGNTSLAQKVQRASLACRGLQPAWYWYGSDNRNMGESWWNLGYETQLGSWQQQDYLLTYASPSTTDFADMMRSSYGAYLAGWANINSGQISSASANIGAAAWLYQSEKGATEYGYVPNFGGWWSWSGEADLGFWGGLRAASVNVVQDPVVGLYAYGGDVSSADGAYTVTPRDGVRSRFTFYNLGSLTVRLAKARYTRAVVSADRRSVVLDLENVVAGSYTATVTALNLPAGTYDVSASGTSATRVVTSTGGQVSFDLPTLSGASKVSIVRR